MGVEWHEMARIWVGAALLAISTGWSIYWSLMIWKRSAAKSEQDKLAERLKSIEAAIVQDERADGDAFRSMESRLQKVEDDIRHLPTKEQFHGLEMSVGEMKADLRVVAAGIQPLGASVERMNNFLMDQAKAR